MTQKEIIHKHSSYVVLDVNSDPFVPKCVRFQLKAAFHFLEFIA